MFHATNQSPITHWVCELGCERNNVMCELRTSSFFLLTTRWTPRHVYGFVTHAQEESNFYERLSKRSLRPGRASDLLATSLKHFLLYYFTLTADVVLRQEGEGGGGPVPDLMTVQSDYLARFAVEIPGYNCRDVAPLEHRQFSRSSRLHGATSQSRVALVTWGPLKGVSLWKEWKILKLISRYVNHFDSECLVLYL